MPMRDDPKARVYVVQETNHDFSDAEKFGDLVFLSVAGGDDFNNVQNGEHNRRLVSHLRHGLREFDPEIDHIVCSGGSPYVSAAVFMMLGQRYGRLRVLRWDNRDLKYIPMLISVV